jgi:MFS family permease
MNIREIHSSARLRPPTPTIDAPNPAASGRLAFGSAVAALAISFAANAAPVPLYNVYRSHDGLTNAGVSLAVVAYSFGTIAALLLLGRLSNHWGRRRTAITSVVLVVIGCLMLLQVHSTGTLVAARLSMGVGSGIASSSLTAYIVDTAPVRPAWLASVAASQGPMFGLALGAVSSGALVEFAPMPRELVYAVLVILLIVTAALLALSPETVSPKTGAWRSLRPEAGLPVRVRHLAPVAAAVFLATWATGAFYQALVPALVEDQLHTTSPLTLGLVFASYMASSALGAPLAGHFTPATAQRVGMLAFLVAMAGIITAVTSGGLPLFIAGTVLAGVSQGVAISATVRGLLVGSTVADRAPIFAVIYLLSYSGAAFPSLLAGALTGTVSLPTIALGYGGLTLAATAFTVLAAREPGIAE